MQLLTTICPKINQKQHYIKYHNKANYNKTTRPNLKKGQRFHFKPNSKAKNKKQPPSHKRCQISRINILNKRCQIYRINV